ncbi:hypothetical protein CAPN002_13130 [Capnocytophaga stomatis]|uniref:DUF445 domain-containing protein n=1 Tax=Capnocytophaga stomatis TaxID=1848904 RepID=UPI0019514BE1|nr:DUF445 domain-containing protein [Capnocytophaga stomatis]GIJ94095.1 hypothetical protein CAPN002_13130 [Capnocytophaga stomatis]GIM49480.1 hypothetical protein CAPN003_09320 [Capnocytophaga stomatis]
MKEKKLRFHKRIATALFLFMTLLYIAMVILQKKAPEWSFVGYIKAFSEAAMVGALADWFAVTALFHKPLGLPIPHTNLIENRKKDIGDNLGNFVVENFLKAENIRPYVENINVSPFIVKYLNKEKNINILIDEVKVKLEEIIQNTNDEKITNFITEKSKLLLQEIELNKLTSNVLEYLLKEKEHQKILDFIFLKIEYYILENKDLIHQKISQESAFFIPNFVDKILADKITAGLANYMAEAAQNEEHSVRKEIEKQLFQFSEDLKNEPHWKEKLENLKGNLLQSENIEKYAKNIWIYIKNFLTEDLSKPLNDSVLKSYLKKSILNFTQQLQTDKQLQNRLDGWSQKTIYQFVLKNKNEVGQLISETVGNWKGRELSEKLELEVGKDLQFIRINGTLVGGLVGLLIYVITQFF